MKSVLATLCAASLFAAVASPAHGADDDCEWEEEVVTTVVRRKKAPKAPPADYGLNNPAPVTAAPNPEPPPPPEPSAEDAAEPRRLVRYFCKCWKDEDYERMWWAMTPKYRAEVPFKKFVKLFSEDKESNGGLADENIVLEDRELDDGAIQVAVDLRYRFKRARIKRVKAEVEKKGPAYRVRESGIIPFDMDDF